MIDAVVWEKLGRNALNMSRPEKAQYLKQVFVDISQNPCRRPYTNTKGITGTMTTSSAYFSFGRDNMVTPFEQLLWHGHSRALKVPDSVRAGQLKALAGEGMSLPCVGLVLWCGLKARC